MLRKCDPEIDPEPPDTVDEGKTELSPLRLEEAKTIHLST